MTSSPSPYSIVADTGMDISIKEIPKMVLETNSNMTTKSAMAMTSDSVIRITEIPEIRAHMPVNLNFGLKIMGLEVMVFSICGEAQLITEKYAPNLRERCEKDPCDPC
jgi:hypothetical protein